ncbi:MAG: cyclic nucleotide-binding domain-containing protein, partial [Nannocystaceae bacterium]
LVATRRGDDLPAQVRVARRGESFGEGAALPGGTHRLTARVAEDATIAVIPVGVLTRETARQDRESKGASSVAARQQRLLTRQATRDLLSTMALTRDLSRDETDLLLDAVEVTAAPRGHRIYDVHDPADGLYMLSSGLVQLQTQDEGRIHVRAYLSAGDFFGDRELLTGETRVHAAVAMGACQLLMLPASAFRTLRDRNPGLVKRMRRIADDRDDTQAKVVEEAGAHTTRHVFADLYRMQMAQSMLTIDQDTCVRCGHCAWSCADTHGVARLVRRGDKILTSVSGETHNLLLPNSCQHCQNPACMIDCPTGAIGRDPRGEVFIREELCTGCGACAKACPWENIRMAPRTPATGLIPLTQLLKKNRAPTTPTSPTGLPNSPTNSPSHSQVGTSPEVATKCDLCRGYEAPACVQACPTGSLIRLDPKQAFSEVAALLGDREQSTQKAGPTKQHRLGNLGLAAVTITTIMAAGSAAALNLRGILEPGTGFGLTLGMLAAVAMLLLVGHSIPKRITRLWMRKRSRSGARTKAPPPARSRLKPLVQLHILLGLLLPAAVLGHAGTTISGTVAGSLHVSLWVLLVLGIWGAIAYRLLPPVLGRLERRGALPEDLVDRRQHLLDRMQREL